MVYNCQLQVIQADVPVLLDTPANLLLNLAKGSKPERRPRCSAGLGTYLSDLGT